MEEAEVEAHRVKHGLIPDQRRVAVGDRNEDSVILDEVVPEDDARHSHCVLGSLFRSYDAHEGLVAEGER
jgi:hypothetical protein